MSKVLPKNEMTLSGTIARAGVHMGVFVVLEGTMFIRTGEVDDVGHTMTASLYDRTVWNQVWENDMMHGTVPLS